MKVHYHTTKQLYLYQIKICCQTLHKKYEITLQNHFE